MDKNIVMEVHKLSENNKSELPDYQTDRAAGMDLRASITNSIVIKPGKSTLVPTGLAMSLPGGYEAQVRPRSGLAAKFGVTVLNSPGTIDSDYRGEVKVILINHGDEPFEINDGDRIAQIVLSKVEKIIWEKIDSLSKTSRGSSGFGSTGKI